MAINTVALLSPGEMGHTVGQLLQEHELRVVTCLAGSSMPPSLAVRQRTGTAQSSTLLVPTLPSLRDRESSDWTCGTSGRKSDRLQESKWPTPP